MDFAAISHTAFGHLRSILGYAHGEPMVDVLIPMLLAAGFREVLLKPLALGALRAAVTRTLGDDSHAVAEAAPPPPDSGPDEFTVLKAFSSFATPDRFAIIGNG